MKKFFDRSTNFFTFSLFHFFTFSLFVAIYLCMIKVLSAEEMREVDRLTTEKYGIPSILLMENAAHAAARIIAEKLGGLVAGKSFLILCGKGNNGGDGAALARILWTIGKKVVVVLFGKVEDTKGDARTNFQILQKIDSEKLHGFLDFIELAEIDFETSFHTIFYNRGFSGGPYGVVVDALFGTGLTRPLDEKFSYVTKILNNKQKWKQSKNEYLLVSLDVPSGLNADSAEAIGENVHADLTVTFTAPKIANVMSPASNFNGELFIADIGSRTLLRNVEPKTYVTDSQKICGFLCETQVRTDSYKKTRGTALILAGSEDFSGAAVLAANACFSAGAGMVSVGVPQTVKDIVASKVADEIIVKTLEYTNVSNEKVDVIALGCGLASDETTRKFVREIVENRQTPIVLDAEALNALAPFDLQGSNEFPLILTPHIG